MEKTELIIAALQQRIGELVSNYETQVAILRAEITGLINEQREKEEEAKKYSEEITKKIGIENPE
jgi:predicted Holliday junction resolvase-like endonuclease